MDNTTYEFFIRRAWKVDRFKKGADTDIWQGLLMANANYNESLGTPNEEKNKKQYEKRFGEVKTFVDNAYRKLLDRAGEAGPVLGELQGRALGAKSPQELFDNLRRSLDVINENGL